MFVLRQRGPLWCVFIKLDTTRIVSKVWRLMWRNGQQLAWPGPSALCSASGETQGACQELWCHKYPPWKLQHCIIIPPSPLLPLSPTHCHTAAHCQHCMCVCMWVCTRLCVYVIRWFKKRAVIVSTATQLSGVGWLFPVSNFGWLCSTLNSGH